MDLYPIQQVYLILEQTLVKILVGASSQLPSPFMNPLSAFGREHLLSDRWLLGSNGRGADGVWHGVLEVTNEKQGLFLDRVFFLHQLAISRSSSTATTTLRLSANQWDSEIELACVAAYVLQKMEGEKDTENKQVFDDKVLKMCRTRFIEGCLVLNWCFFGVWIALKKLSLEIALFGKNQPEIKGVNRIDLGIFLTT